MARNPLEDVARGLRVIGERLSQGGEPGDWISDQFDALRKQEPAKSLEELGARVLHQWATLGEFDFVSVVEAPDTATVARVSVALGARGSAKLQTMAALEIDAFLNSLS